MESTGALKQRIVPSPSCLVNSAERQFWTGGGKTPDNLELFGGDDAGRELRLFVDVADWRDRLPTQRRRRFWLDLVRALNAAVLEHLHDTSAHAGLVQLVVQLDGIGRTVVLPSDLDVAELIHENQPGACGSQRPVMPIGS